MLRLKRNYKRKCEQFIRFLNVRVKDFTLFKEKEEKKSINYAFIRRFKLSCKRSVHSAALDRLLDSAASFRLRTRTRHILYEFNIWKKI